MRNRQSKSGSQRIVESIRKQHRDVNAAIALVEDRARTRAELDCQLARIDKAYIATGPRYLDSVRSYFTNAYNKKATEYEAAARILRDIEIQLLRLGQLKLRNDGLEQEYKDVKQRLAKLRLSTKFRGLLCRLIQGFNRDRDPDKFSFLEQLHIELRVAAHGIVSRAVFMIIFVASWAVLIVLAYFLLPIVFGLD